MKKLNTKNNTQVQQEKNKVTVEGEIIPSHENPEGKRWYVYLLKYGIAAAVGGGIVCMCLGLRNFWSGEQFNQETLYRYLADAFSIPGAILILAAVFMWIVGAGGAITGLAYGLKHFVTHLIPMNLKKEETYADFLARRKKPHGYSFLIIVGACYLLVGIIFIILFYQVYQGN